MVDVVDTRFPKDEEVLKVPPPGATLVDEVVPLKVAALKPKAPKEPFAPTFPKPDEDDEAPPPPPKEDVVDTLVPITPEEVLAC